MRKLRHIMLRDQIRIMFSLILILIFVILAVVIRIVHNMSRDAGRQNLRNTVNQLTLGVETHWSVLSDQARVLAYNNYVLDFVQSETPGDRYTSYTKTLSFISSIEATNNDIDRFIYANGDMLYIANSYFTEYGALSRVLDEYLAKPPAAAGETRYFRIDPGVDGESLYAIIGNTYYDSFLQKRLMMILLINRDPLVTLVENAASYHSIILLLDDRDGLIAGNGVKSTDDIARLLREGREGPKDGDSFYYETRIRGPGWKVVAFSDAFLLSGSENESVRWIVLISLCMTLLISLFVLIISNNVIRPIVRITSFVQSVTDDYPTRRLHIKKHNEIGIMGQGINRMLDSIATLNESMTRARETLYLNEIAKRQIHIEALQSQINPHFLYNTLDCIRGIALKENVTAVADVASAVSRIFRYSIKAADYVLVMDEINCIRDYMVIIGIRHNNRFTASFQIEEALLGITIPKMILQPMVENAVFHGLEPQKGPGSIAIEAYREGDSVLFYIRDDGVGIEEERLSRLRATLSGAPVAQPDVSGKEYVGLLNIYQRLSLIYGAGFSMRVERRKSGGTEIRIRLPEKA